MGPQSHGEPPGGVLAMDFTHTLDHASYEAYKTADEREYELRLQNAMSKSVDAGVSRRDKEGWLWKEGKGSKEWRRCYFIVCGNLCNIYKNENKTEKMGSFSLEQIVSVKVSSLKNKRPYCFVVSVEDKGMYYIAGQSFDDMLDWMLCFARSNQRLSNLMDDAQETYLNNLERDNAELTEDNSRKKDEIDDLTAKHQLAESKRKEAELEVARLQEASSKREMVIDRLKSRQDEENMVGASKTCLIS